MKIYLSDQRKKFEDHLQRLMSDPVTTCDMRRLKHMVSTIEIATTQPLDAVNLSSLRDYHIFPEHIMTAYTQWAHEGRAMLPGDTIVQQAYLPPTKRFSQKLVFGVRVKDIFNEPGRSGFSYETIAGHVEKGLSSFTLRETAGRISFVIETYSGAGNLLTSLLAPVISRPYQAYCTRSALRHVKAQLEMRG